MDAFSELAVNNYLLSIANNQSEIQSFANDLETDFIHAFETRFIMDPASLASLQSWPQATKDVLIQTAKTTALLHGLYNTNPAIMTTIGFEAPTGKMSASAAAGSVEVTGSVTTKTDIATGHTVVEAKVEAKWTIC
ncbi:MAG: hypothetical protein N2319_12255 [Candidatus Kapabacteria bacterium]|nr:hypothetical protein [Candidatus Kapabacteria bacterium]